MNQVIHHIHCPHCLGGILEHLGRPEQVYPNSDNGNQEILTNEVFACSVCQRYFKRSGLGEIKLIFD